MAAEPTIFGGFLGLRLLVWFNDLPVMVIEQVSGGVIDLRHGQLEIHLGLNEIQLGIGKLDLRVQNAENRLGIKLVLAFVGMKGVAGKVRSHLCGFHRKLSLLEGVDGVGNLERDALTGPAFLVLIAATADQGIGQIGLCRVSPYRKGEGERGAVRRVSEVESLAKTIPEARATG